MKTLPQPWSAAMEATVFTGWIYDDLQPHAAAMKVAHPLMLRAIAAGKKKKDRVDASKICDCLRCDFLPECYKIQHKNLWWIDLEKAKTANGSLVLSERGTTAERPTHATKNQKEFCTRAPPKRARRAFALLTKTYHGSRLIGQAPTKLRTS
jgi:hypothetical protein